MARGPRVRAVRHGGCGVAGGVLRGWFGDWVLVWDHGVRVMVFFQQISHKSLGVSGFPGAAAAGDFPAHCLFYAFCKAVPIKGQLLREISQYVLINTKRFLHLNFGASFPKLFRHINQPVVGSIAFITTCRPTQYPIRMMCNWRSFCSDKINLTKRIGRYLLDTKKPGGARTPSGLAATKIGAMS